MRSPPSSGLALGACYNFPLHVALMLAIGPMASEQVGRNVYGNKLHRQREPVHLHLPGDLPARHIWPIQSCRVQQDIALALNHRYC